MKNLILALGFLTLTIAGTASSGEITFSTKPEALTMHTDFLGGDDLELHQGQLVERDPSGKLIQKMIVKTNGSTWSPPVLRDGVFTTSYDTGTKDIGLSLKTTVHIGVLTSSTVEDVLCSACSGGTEGVCQNARSKTCAAATTAGGCPRRFSKCTEHKVVQVNTMLISLEVNWKFQDPANTLHYEIELNTKKAKTKGKHTKYASSSLQDTQFLAVPKQGVLLGPSGEKRVVDVPVSIKYGDHKNTMSFELPAFEEGWVLRY